MKEIKAKQGFYLTQSAEVGDKRIFVKTIKGENVNEVDWREADKAEKENFDKEHKKQSPLRSNRVIRS